MVTGHSMPGSLGRSKRGRALSRLVQEEKISDRAAPSLPKIVLRRPVRPDAFLSYIRGDNDNNASSDYTDDGLRTIHK